MMIPVMDVKGFGVITERNSSFEAPSLSHGEKSIVKPSVGKDEYWFPRLLQEAKRLRGRQPMRCEDSCEAKRVWSEIPTCSS